MWEGLDSIINLMVSFHSKWGDDVEDNFDEETWRKKLTNREEYLRKNKERRAQAD